MNRRFKIILMILIGLLILSLIIKLFNNNDPIILPDIENIILNDNEINF